MKLSLKQIAEAVKGEIYNNDESLIIEGVSTDTRKSIENKLFIPIKGPNFDGHLFLHMAIEKRASCLLSEIRINTQLPYILVEDSNKAIMDLAAYYRKMFNIPIVAVTGSAGKTSTKDLTAEVLSEKYKVLKTDGNLNNEVGLPLMVFQFEEDIEIAVLEMGMNSFGEIHNLSRIATPSVALITNIGIAHIGNLGGTREGILKAKSEVFDFMPKGGRAILNMDDDMLSKLNICGISNYYFSRKDKNAYVYAKNIEHKGIDGINAVFVHGDIEFPVYIPVAGEHMVDNALGAAAAGFLFGLSSEEIARGIAKFKPSKNRMDIIRLEKYTIINDVYNANPVSVMSVLKILEMAEGRKVAVLGDMKELGDDGERLHYDLGRDMIGMNIDVAVFIGALSKASYEGALKEMKAKGCKKDLYYFESRDDFMNEGLDILSKGDTVLVKASRGMEFEKLIEKLTRC
ncbi:UDP-N-acetylmuramoyl-tripeptide--D-alanyl-D-alanine ligase [Anaeropeptidivorans aminofermentans]|uniref:UDP-N-acetylmuramoyl-tripeptide--D-alanyl-D- alanine ligase n=1 Tax=Anaeropeptidivorans aminofermentans TaxID=2934315 RepID=UPI0020255EDE|nr:UDP-N-acetylmuramoyl-tripeptide--D-alanyl-D-alanine ligase [Anaeropeptidivorans aminofermentans]